MVMDYGPEFPTSQELHDVQIFAAQSALRPRCESAMTLPRVAIALYLFVWA
jgi:hypothetical protein